MFITKKDNLKKILVFAILVLLSPILWVIYLITYVIPKQKNKWVFGASFGEAYIDNSKYIFEYVSKDEKDINAIWITKKHSIKNDILKDGNQAYHAWSLYGIWHILTAEVAFFTHDKRDINSLFLNTRCKLIQLWHGMGLKKIGKDDSKDIRNTNIIMNTLWNNIKLKHSHKWDLWPVSGTLNQESFARSFSVPIENVVILGTPREDKILQSLTNNKVNKKNNSIIILYAPTYRKGDGILKCLPSEKECNKINNLLKEQSAILKIRLHRGDRHYLSNIKQFSNIKIDYTDDMQDSLINTDILITDYSSCCFDFLLLDKPIIFAILDLKEYLTNERGLLYDFNDYSPGPKCKSWDEILQSIDDSINNPKKHHKERKELLDKIYDFKDGKTCARICEYIRSHLI
jgi:CDP-glycerol glycerophosphotransferase (TagB/SpsB family)